jgi:hypothetical protein
LQSTLPPNSRGSTLEMRPYSGRGAVARMPKNGASGIVGPQASVAVMFFRSMGVTHRWNSGKSSGRLPRSGRITFQPQSAVSSIARIFTSSVSPGSAPRTAIGPVRMCAPSTGLSFVAIS